MRLSIVVPVLDEAEGIAASLQPLQVLRAQGHEVLVVDGHSTDGSPERLQADGFRVLQDNSRGKGDAVRIGIGAATGDILVTMDADGSHEPAQIRELVAPIERGEADLVIGCRMRGGSDEFAGTWTMFVRPWGNNFLTQSINTRFGASLTDSQNGFRAIRAEIARRLALKEDKHTIELEMVLKALKQGFRVCQVPSHEYARRSGESSLSVVRQTPAFLSCLLRNIW